MREAHLRFTAHSIKLINCAYQNASSVFSRQTSSFMYIKYIHKQDPNNNGLKHIIQRCTLIHPYHFKGQCIQVATMFIFKCNINRNQEFSITMLKILFYDNKNSKDPKLRFQSLLLCSRIDL